MHKIHKQLETFDKKCHMFLTLLGYAIKISTDYIKNRCIYIHLFIITNRLKVAKRNICGPKKRIPIFQFAKTRNPIKTNG
jgi:hypothetical protein